MNSGREVSCELVPQTTEGAIETEGVGRNPVANSIEQLTPITLAFPAHPLP